jgi:MFS family permease
VTDTAAGPLAFAVPLRYPAYRRVWIASLFSNLGQFVQSVGAAWAMTRVAGSSGLVALVQTASLMPIMLLAVPAGAFADLYDRRKVQLIALALSFTSATLLTIISWTGAATPILLLFFSFLIGSGAALFSPAWQVSIRSQVPAEYFSAAIALRSVSYNAGRSLGPAVGGLVVAMAGPVTAFIIAAIFYVPMLVVTFRSPPEREAHTLPPERARGAIGTGLRYILHSPIVRTVLLRSLVVGLAGGGVAALMPLIARDLLHGRSGIYGVLLGAYGLGAVVGAMLLTEAQRWMSAETATRWCGLVVALGALVVGLSTNLAVTIVALLVTGIAWMLLAAFFNIGIQLRTPRWVAARVVAAFQATIAGGAAIGSWLWGETSQHLGTGNALFGIAAAMLLVTLAGGVLLRMPDTIEQPRESLDPIADPEVGLELSNDSGPVEIELHYHLDPTNTDRFREAMQKLHYIRLRNGAQSWSLARDIVDETLWIERFVCATWVGYLRQRQRITQDERELQRSTTKLLLENWPLRVTRRLVDRVR